MVRFIGHFFEQWPTRPRKPGLTDLLCAALALLCLALPGWWALSRNHAERVTELRHALNADVQAKRRSLRDWAESVRQEAVWRCTHPDIRTAAEELVRHGQERPGPREAPPPAQLTTLLSRSSGPDFPLATRFSGFVVVNTEGIAVAGDDHGLVGRNFPVEPGSALGVALSGEPRLSHIGTSAIASSQAPPAFQGSQWTILMAVPIRSASGEVIAAAGFFAPLDDGVLKRVQGAEPGGQTRTYAFLSSGEWLYSTPEPLDSSLGPDANQELPPAPEVLARLSRDPKLGPDFGTEQIFSNLEGYDGCRGNQVVGTVAALPELGLGLMAELDFDNAYRVAFRARSIVIALTFVLGFCLLLLVLNQTSATIPASGSGRQQGRNSAAWAILTVSLLATGIVWWATKSKVNEYDRSRFERESDIIRTNLLDRMERYSHLLQTIQASYHAFGSIQQEDWRRLAQELQLPESFPAVDYLAFVATVPQAQMQLFESAAHSNGMPTYRVHPAGSQPDYFPIQYIEPAHGNRQHLGFDIGSSQALRTLAVQSRESGQLIVSGVAAQLSRSGTDAGFLILAPVYADDAGVQRRAHRGWVAAFVRTAEIMKNLAGAATEDIDFEVFEGDVSENSLVYDHNGFPQAAGNRRAARFEKAVPVEFGGRNWTVVFNSTNEFNAPITQNHPAQVLLGGLAISVLLFDIALVLSSTRSRALAIAELMTRRLRDGEARIRAVIDHAPDGIITFDHHGVVQTFNPGAEKLFHYSSEEVIGFRIARLLPAPFWDDMTDFAPGETAAGSAKQIFRGSQECVGRRTDGTEFPAELTVSRMQLNEGIRFTAIVRDVSERKAAEEALRESEERYALAARAANDGLWDWDLRTDQVYYSPRWKAMLGLTDQDFVSRPDAWFSRVYSEDLKRLQKKLSEHLTGQSVHFESEHRMQHSDGTYRWMLCRGIAVRDESGLAVRFAGSQADVTDRKQAERQLLYDALHDPLTGLPNRTYFMGQLERATNETQRRPGRLFAVLFLDLDRFKLVNDSLGHFVGDQLLIAIADRLKICLRPGDTIARLGGDEFAVLVENLTDVSDATHIADRIQKDLALPFRVGEQEVFTTVSIGITLSATGRQSAEDLLRDADTAMYRAKAQGKARYELFDQGMHTRAVEFLLLETSLRRALERDELRVDYQPIVSLQSGRITRCEALLRWEHPERGRLMPREFIPVAEETGLIMPMSAWLLRKVCAQTKAWRAAGLTPIRMAVNISPRQLKQQNLCDVVTQVLSETGVEPETLELELTESALMESSDATIQPLIELYSRGVRISLDDFGTGYSSLMYLQRFPINTLKIDGSFVRDITTDPGDAAIASGLIALAHSLNLNVTAEGVETAGQLDFLRRKGCDEVQGNLISMPIDAESFALLLQRDALLSGPSALQTTQI